LLLESDTREKEEEWRLLGVEFLFAIEEMEVDRLTPGPRLLLVRLLRGGRKSSLSCR
jgi:hypothetical protein